MEIEMLDIDKLKPYENNARNNEKAIPKVKTSIKEFGFKNPILIDKDNVIIAGHTRLEAAKELKINKVPCIRIEDLPEEKIKAFRLADNKVSEFSTWDFETLTAELDSLKNLEIDFNNLGFFKLDPIEFPTDDLSDVEAPEDKKEKLCCCPKCKYKALEKEFKVK